jgi:hypothetical protein
LAKEVYDKRVPDFWGAGLDQSDGCAFFHPRADWRNPNQPLLALLGMGAFGRLTAAYTTTKRDYPNRATDSPFRVMATFLLALKLGMTSGRHRWDPETCLRLAVLRR